MTEQNPANGNLEWETSYSYDALDNLTQINQGGQLRTFAYDAKGRLKSETTPGSGKDRLRLHRLRRRQYPHGRERGGDHLYVWAAEPADRREL